MPVHPICDRAMQRPPPFPTFPFNGAPRAKSLQALVAAAHERDQVAEIYPSVRIANPSAAFADLWHFPASVQRSANFAPGTFTTAPATVRSMTEALFHLKTGLIFNRDGQVMKESLGAEYFRDPSWNKIAPIAAEGQYLARKGPPARLASKGPATLYANHGGYTVFGHLMFETMPMALIFAQMLAAGQMTLLMPPTTSPGLPNALLESIGLPASVQTRSDEPFVWRRSVVVASTCSGQNTFAAGPLQLGFARTMKATARIQKGQRRLYLTRTGARTTQRRDLVNEADLIAALGPLGFEAVNPGMMTPREQIALFAEAECLVALSGSVWANLIYASPGTLVVDLLAEHKAAVDDAFGINTAKTMALPYILILTPSNGPKAGDIDVVADVPLVVDRIQRGLERAKALGLR